MKLRAVGYLSRRNGSQRGAEDRRGKRPASTDLRAQGPHGREGCSRNFRDEKSRLAGVPEQGAARGRHGLVVLLRGESSGRRSVRSAGRATVIEGRCRNSLVPAGEGSRPFFPCVRHDGGGSRCLGALGCMAYGLDAVPVGISDEGGVVVGMIYSGDRELHAELPGHRTVVRAAPPSSSPTNQCRRALGWGSWGETNRARFPS
jgi:hypothetical protein